MAAPTISLNNGMECPLMGLGTWLAAPGEVKEVVKYAIDIGYRHFDCAYLYGNEKEIGEGLREKIEDGTVKREEIFITTKLWNIFHEEEKVVPACEESLKNFGLDYVDLYLIHWPCAQKNLSKFNWQDPFRDVVDIEYDFVLTWKKMEECVRLGIAKSIGLSNFNSKQIQRILDHAEIMPVMNQIEVTPLLTQKELVKFCQDRKIEITAYSPLGSPARTWKIPGDPSLDLDDHRLVKIGNRYGKKGSQVILRYLVQRNIIVIPKSSNKERIKQNFEIFDFQLTSEEMAEVDNFNRNCRLVPAMDLVNSVDFPFKEDF